MWLPFADFSFSSLLSSLLILVASNVPDAFWLIKFDIESEFIGLNDF